MERPLAREPRRRDARPRPAALPADRPLLPPGGLRGPDAMVAEGRIAAYGVSVERVEEALKAIEYPNVATVQIIFNPFRQRPAGRVLRRGRAPRRRHHRARAAGLGPAVGQVHARDDVRRRRPPQLQPRTARRSTSARRSRACRSRSASTPSRSCARWCRTARRSPSSRCAGSSCTTPCPTVIPGARTPEQAQGNAAAAALPALDDERDGAVARGLRGAHRAARAPALVVSRAAPA